MIERHGLPIRLGGPNKIWGPGIDLRTSWKIFSLRPWLYAKMLKETENEETRLFCQIFVIGGISIEGAQVP